MERDFSRGLDIFNPENFSNKKVWIIGAGWIGSNSAYALAKMWIKVKVCDFDEVDSVNTSSQFYSMEQLWKPKVEMLKENIKAMCNEDIEIVNDKYKPEYFEDCDILILALDSLKVRKEVVETCKDDQFILDTRMVKKLSIINTLYWFQRDVRMEKEWREDADAIDEGTRCTEKAVAFNALAMAWLVWSLVCDYLNGAILKYSYQLDLVNYKLYVFSS